MQNLNSYKLKLTALTPIHIGTGEVYEPSNFVINNGKLYEFDEVLFYQSLNALDKKALETKLNNWMQIIDFYKSKISEAIKIANFSCVSTSKVEEHYKKIKNEDGSKNNNQFHISKTFKNPNTHRAIIPGSSIKGMLDTVLKIYPAKINENEPRQNLIISDALLLGGNVEIGYSYRVHKNPTKEAKSSIPQILEIIAPASSFICHIKTEFSFEKLKELMKSYRKEREGDFFEEDNRSFVARVGKFCGKEYMVDDSKYFTNSYGKPIATHTIYETGAQSFGWIRFELISDEEYQNSLKDIKIQEESYFKELALRQKDLLEIIENTKKQAQKEIFDKEQKKLKEEQELENAKKIKAEELSKMSPVKQSIEKCKELEPDKNISLTILILNNIKNGFFEELTQDACKYLKEHMIEHNEWKEEEPKQKPPKPYKDYQRTLEVKKMLR